MFKKFWYNNDCITQTMKILQGTYLFVFLDLNTLKNAFS